MEALAPENEGCEFQGWILWGWREALLSNLTGARGPWKQCLPAQS